MLFQDEFSEDKGLFTFYREQAEKEEELIKHKKLEREQKMMHLKPIPQLPPISPVQKMSPVKLNTIRKTHSLKEDIQKVKPALAKQRLLQSVVDLGKPYQQKSQKHIGKQQLLLRFKEPKFIEKSRRYRQKLSGLNISTPHECPFSQEQVLANQLVLQSFHHRNQSEELITSRLKPAIHTARVSVELPQIKKPEEQKPSLKNRKSIKSQFIQQALRIKDLDKIKNMRQYLKGRSSAQFQQDQEMHSAQQLYIDSKSFQAFKSHQQRLVSVLKKFKRKF